MARPIETGLRYFNVDTELDKKLKLIKAKYKLEGIGFIDMLWRTIYAEGYYLKIDNDYITILADEWGLTSEKFLEILEYCLKQRLFDNQLWEEHKILTSYGIQKRFFHATLRRKIKGMEFLLTETCINDNNNTTKEYAITPDIAYNNPTKQSKVKQSKVKQSKVNISIPPNKIDLVNYFIEIECTEEDGDAFYDYFQSNGWKVGGKTLMKDWKAAARNWKRNKNKYGMKDGTVKQDTRQGYKKGFKLDLSKYPTIRDGTKETSS